jgi:hypothetical protein
MYDGVISWVKKFVLKEKSAKKDINKYLEDTDIEAVKLDKLYPISLENLIAYKINGDASEVDIFNTYILMYDE